MKRQPKTDAGYWTDTETAERQARADGYEAGYEARPRVPTAGTIPAAWLAGYDQAAHDTETK